MFLYITINQYTENSSFNHVKNSVFNVHIKKVKGRHSASWIQRGPWFKLCFKQFLQQYLTRLRLENDRMTYPHCLTTSVCRIINTLFQNVLDIRQTYRKQWKLMQTLHVFTEEIRKHTKYQEKSFCVFFFARPRLS